MNIDIIVVIIKNRKIVYDCSVYEKAKVLNEGSGSYFSLNFKSQNFNSC